jgi:hypothetical protein
MYGRVEIFEYRQRLFVQSFLVGMVLCQLLGGYLNNLYSQCMHDDIKREPFPQQVRCSNTNRPGFRSTRPPFDKVLVFVRITYFL